MPFLAVWVSLAGALFAFGNQSSVKRSDGRDIATSEIDATITALMEAAHVTGTGIAVFHEGRIAYLKAYGYRDTEKRLPLTNEAIRLRYGLGWGLYSSPYGKAFFKEGHDEGWRHLALCFNNGSGILIMTNSSNGEGVFKPLIDSVLGATSFPFDWENYTPYNLLPPSSDECTFKPDGNGPAQVLILHVDGKDLELKRVE